MAAKQLQMDTWLLLTAYNKPPVCDGTTADPLQLTV